MAFFHQLRLLIWKNGLGVVRQPGWSLTVILWPIVIFIILAITRRQFPPVMKDPCYVGPRNLPSAGLFPFLQTLMCNTDSSCHNVSRLLDSSRSTKSHSRSGHLPPFESIFKAGSLIKSALTENSTGNPAEMLALWDALLSTPYGGGATPGNRQWSNTSLLGNFSSPLSVQNASDALMESLHVLKTSMCTVGLALANSSSSHPLYSAMRHFCESDKPVLEVSLYTINQILMDLVNTEGNVLLPMAAQVVVMFDQLQNHSALWDSLLAVPHLFSNSSADEGLAAVGELLANAQGALDLFQESFPGAGSSVPLLHTLLTGGTNIIRYTQDWPGRDVHISLGDVVMWQDGTLDELAKQVLRQIRIPLDKALFLLLDRDMARSYICQNSGSSIALSTACSTGMVDMVLGWISPDKLAKQTLLKWSREVAPGDLTFVKGLLHSSMGGPMEKPPDSRRRRRSADTEGPSNIDQDLFLNMGGVVVEALKAIPEADLVVQSILRGGLVTMQSANLVVHTLENTILSVFKDVHHLQNTYMMLMTNGSWTDAWVGQVLNSTVEMAMEVLSPTGPITCEQLMGHYDWLLHSECLDQDVWKAIICQNMTHLDQTLAMEWFPLYYMISESYNNISSHGGDPVTLPMILSEWHMLYNNTMNLPMSLVDTLSTYTPEAWMPGNNTDDMADILQQRVMMALASLGDRMQGSPLGPQVGRYAQMTSWILNYRPGNTTEPANCHSDPQSMEVYCDAAVDWPQFVQAAAQALLSLPTKPEMMISYLKGTVNLLEHIYGNILRGLMASHLPQQIPESHAVSHYLMEMITHLQGFVLKLASLKDNDISDPQQILPHIYNLLKSTGLGPLVPLFGSSAPINASTLLEAALHLGRQNQNLFTFNNTHPDPELERLIMSLLSMEGNLTLPLSLGMGQTLLTYSAYLRPEDLSSLQMAAQTLTNQSTAGLTECVLSTVELLNDLLKAPGDPTTIVLTFLKQLQEFWVSALRLRRIDQARLPNGQLSAGQVTDLHLVTLDLLQLLSPERLQSLSQAGPNATQQLITQKLLAFLPEELRALATDLLQEVQLLGSQLWFCTSTGEDCVASLSQMLKFLQEVSTMVQAGEGNVTVQIAPTNPFLQTPSSMDATAAVLSLALPRREARYVQAIRGLLHFVTLLMDAPRPTVAQAQDALRQSNLTLAELDALAALLGSANVNGLLVNVAGLVDVQQCFAGPPGPGVQCATGLIGRVSGFLSDVPAFRNESAVFALVPELLGALIVDAQQAITSYGPHLSTVLILNSTLANVMVGLHQLHLSSPEVMREMEVLQGLLKLSSVQPYMTSNTSMSDATYEAQLEIVQWYLGKLENITSSSELSELLHPIYRMAELEVAIQLSSTHFSQFVSDQVAHLMNDLKYPIDGEGANKIGLVMIEIAREQIKIILNHLELNNNFAQSLGQPTMCNATTLHAVSYQSGLYLDLIHNWMRDPNLTMVLDSMLQWGNSSLNLSTPGKDLHQLLQSVAFFLNEEQLAYYSVISNITQFLRQALAAAEQPGGLQSDRFSEAILAAVHEVLKSLDHETGPLQHNVLALAAGSLQLILNPDMSFASARNLSLHILRQAEAFFRLTLPYEAADYLTSGIKMVITYFETISMPDGRDVFNVIILNELITVRGLLPVNCTAEAYLTMAIDITQAIVADDPGRASVGNTSSEVLSVISEIQTFLSTVWPMLTEALGFPSQAPHITAFVNLPHVLEQIMTGSANPGTWNKLEMMLSALLTVVQGTPMWEDNVPVVWMMETVLQAQVKNMQAQNGLVQSVQGPLSVLTAELLRSINSSRVNVSVVQERLQQAIEHTVQAAGQTNGTLECYQVLALWEPVGGAAGLESDTMKAWCQLNLKPVLQSFAESQVAYDNLDLKNAAPGAANGTAAKLAAALRSLYQASIDSNHVWEQLVTALAMQLSDLQPLSSEAQAHWQQQSMEMQLQQSWASFEMLLRQLLAEAPFLQAFVDAAKPAAHLLLSSLPSMPDADAIAAETSHMFFHRLNLTDFPGAPEDRNATAPDQPPVLLLMKQVARLVVQTQLFGDTPDLYRGLQRFVLSRAARALAEAVSELWRWGEDPQGDGADWASRLPAPIQAVLVAIVDILDQVGVRLPGSAEFFGDMAWDLTHAEHTPTGGHYHNQSQWGSVTGGPPMYGGVRPAGNPGARSRRRRDAPPMREPMNNAVDLLFVDYQSLFRAVSIPPSPGELLETAHVFFANPDLNLVMKGAAMGHAWGGGLPESVDTVLGVLAYFTDPEVYAAPLSPMEVLSAMAHLFPEVLPYSELIKRFTRSLAMESPGNLVLLQQMFDTAAELLHTSMMDERYPHILRNLSHQVCEVESMEAAQVLLGAGHADPGQLCSALTPALDGLMQILPLNTSSLTELLYSTFIGEPTAYNVNRDWTSALTDGFGFNISSIEGFNVNITKPDRAAVRELLRDEEAFLIDVHRHLTFDPRVLHLLLNTTLPDNLATLSWLVSLRHCGDRPYDRMGDPDAVIYQTFCSMSAQDWYTFSVLVARHVNNEKLIYRLVMSEELQSMVGFMLQMTSFLTDMMGRLNPVVDQLQGFLSSVNELSLMSDPKFHRMVKASQDEVTSRSLLTTASRALCKNGVMALFGLSKLTSMTEGDPASPSTPEREEIITKFKIPRDATPFCMKLFVDMVNTTGGAIAWAFLKPMLMGDILFTPDTPATRNIMEKANGTLQEFANLTRYSQDWIDSSDYILQSAKMLTGTLPMLQNSLGNAFVKKFIEMQTDINVDDLKETLGNFAGMAVELEKNKQVLQQVTTLSNLMVNISSCIKFDRYRGFDSADEMNAVAQQLATNRDLYASVIFKLPGGGGRSANGSGAGRPLPRRVAYTIRMHMDNVMRTDRTRLPYLIRAPHIDLRDTMRYTRGFVYLQESLDRAIIAAQTGRGGRAGPAVQMQPFPYPCFSRDEYLEAISFVFPVMLMIAWVLFVADFVKKLVYERELRLHEYMKMMGVNPLSHFCAWFLDCAAHLLFTIAIMTLVLQVGGVLPNSDGLLVFLFLCDYGLSIIALSFLVSSFFDQTYIAGLTGSLVYVLCFFPFIIVMGMESSLNFSEKSALGLLAPTCFSYATQYMSRYEYQGIGIKWSNAYTSPIHEDTSSFGWMCWLLLIDSALYFLLGGYVRMVFPGQYGIAAPWYFPVTRSFWADLCCRCGQTRGQGPSGLFIPNILQSNPPVFPNDKEKDQHVFSSGSSEEFRGLPVGVALRRLTKMYGERAALNDLSVSFYEGHVTSLLGHNGAGKTTTMSLLTGLFAPTSGSIEVYGRDMLVHIDDVRKDLGVCMQYDVLFNHMTAKEHLLLYGRIKAPQWTQGQLHEQVRRTLEETGMYAHRHKRVGALSGGMRRKLSICIAFIGGSRLVVLDEPTTGVDPCSRRSIWDMVVQHKPGRTIIMSTHHLDEAEVLSDRIAFLQSGGLKCCGSPFQLKDRLGQGYKLTLTRKVQAAGAGPGLDSAELKAFIQAHLPEARLKEAQGGDLVYTLPPFTSASAASYRSLLSALDANLDALQLGGYGVSDTTLEEVFLHLTQSDPNAGVSPLSISDSVSDSASLDSFSVEPHAGLSAPGDNIFLAGSSAVGGAALVWQRVWALLVKRFHHTRRDWKGLLTKVLLPVVFVVFAMGLGSIKSDMQHFPEMELSPALYSVGPSYSFFSNRNPSSSGLVDAMLSFPGLDNACLGGDSDNLVCGRSSQSKEWVSSGNRSQVFSTCKCTPREQVCSDHLYQPPHQKVPSSQTVYNLTGLNVEKYLIATANEYVRNRYGGFDVGQPLPPDLLMDLHEVPQNRSLAKVWYNPEGHHSMPAYLNSLNNFILRSNLPADQQQYAISISSHPYFGRADDEDAVVHGMIQILVAICVLTGFAIMTSSFAIYEVQEHHSGAKRLQHISGVGEPLYWTVNFLYDMMLYLIPVFLTVAVIAAFQIPAFTDRQNLAAVTLLLVLFGFATFPWMYLLAGVFKDAEMAFISYVCINLFISINTVLPTSILFFMSQLSKTDTEAIQLVFERVCRGLLVFPQFSFGNGIMELARNNMEVQLLSAYGVDAYKDPFSAAGLGPMFLASLLQGLVFFTLRLLLNRWLLRKVWRLTLGRKVPAPVAVAEDNEDQDVKAEHARVSGGEAGSDLLQVSRLSKVYQHLNKKVRAVNQVSLGIPAGECFGLLGVNGAGKTTTFKMLTGDISPTDGTAKIKDVDGRLVDIMECRDRGINIGYCPQVDALDHLLTGEEHLYFYARIRGIPKREIDGVVNNLLRKLELVYHRDDVAEGYSCGTRRKLSTALALIGHPQILLLDEPSSGMDPRTKRHLWKIISEEVMGKCAVVLTSHSMEECEALCSRLAIMVKGQFRCLGSLQHIKNRFGTGFTVKMYLTLASCDVDAITAFMRNHFPSTYLKDQHSTMVEYHVPVAPGGVADIFHQLETNKNALQIKHFSVSQTTLDEVFINFAMEKTGIMDSILTPSGDGDSFGPIPV